MAKVISYGADSNANAKTELLVFCQRKSNKSIQQGDIVYKIEMWGNEYQATVKLNCFGGDEFAGELCATERQAEMAAAHQALVAHADELEQQRAMKRKALEDARDAQKFPRVDMQPPAMQMQPQGMQMQPQAMQSEESLTIDDADVEARLQMVLMQILGRQPESTDLVYDFATTADGGTRARLSLPTTPGCEGKHFHAITPSEQSAKLQVSTQAVTWIMKLPQMMPPMGAMPVEDSSGKMGGKGYGKMEGCGKMGKKGCAKGKEMASMMPMMMMMMKGMKGMKGGGKESGGGKPDFMEMMAGMFGKGGCGKGKGMDFMSGFMG